MLTPKEFDALPEAEKRRLRCLHRDTLASGEREIRPAVMGNRTATPPPDTTTGRSQLDDAELVETIRRNNAADRARFEAMRKPPTGGWS